MKWLELLFGFVNTECGVGNKADVRNEEITKENMVRKKSSSRKRGTVKKVNV
jgi:hypothetical protein